MDAWRETRFVIGPNASLSVRGAWLFMGLASFVTLGCAVGAACFGLWPVLPFAGLELAALGAALLVSMHSNRYREVVTFTADEVVIEFGLAGVGSQARIVLPRAWTRTWIECGEVPHQPTRLLLGSSGRNIEVGRCLTDAEREQLVARFRSILQSSRNVAGMRAA